jgi:tRNA(Ile)-lysidine synthase
LAVRAALASVPPGTPLLVACSGGADSTALAAAAAHLTDRWPVHAAVVDHGLQDGSAGVAVRTADLLEGLGLPTRVLTVEVDGPGGVEAAARRARYAALRAARPTPESPVLLGHTLDDQAETVLLGLGRGSGARSLAGMAAWNPPWLRPLLGLRRETTRAACAALGLPVWDDPHNADARFTRVRLRREVLPLLEDVLAGGVAEALARTAAQLADDDAALTAVAAAARTAAERPAAEGPAGSPNAAERPAAELDAAVLAGHPAAVRRRVLRSWLLDSGVRELTDDHLRAVDALVGRWRGQGGPALPGGLEVVRVAGRLTVRPVTAENLTSGSSFAGPNEGTLDA